MHDDRFVTYEVVRPKTYREVLAALTDQEKNDILSDFLYCLKADRMRDVIAEEGGARTPSPDHRPDWASLRILRKWVRA